MIVSVSRREDIPRYRAPWFMDRIREGFVAVPNPYNARQIKRVLLVPEEVDALVFWTRDPRPLLPYLAELDERGYLYYFMMTITGYPAILEPGGPGREEAKEALHSLSSHIGRRRCIWRYDPILLSNLTDGDFHLNNFEFLAETLKDLVSRVVVSGYDEYKSSKKRLLALQQKGFRLYPLREGSGSKFLPETRLLLGKLAEIASNAALDIRSCSEPEDLSDLGIQANACVDAELIKELQTTTGKVVISASSDLFAHNGAYTPPKVKRDRNQRPACLCTPSVDIGTYGLCKAACAYCYARR